MNQWKNALFSLGIFFIIPITLHSMEKFIPWAKTATTQLNKNLLHWEWDKIDPTKIKDKPISLFFKEHINTVSQRIDSHHQWLWGVGTSAGQIEGNCTNNQWKLFEGALIDGKKIEPAGLACNSWAHEDADIQRMKELGVNSYRFSIEWSKVMPSPNVFDWQIIKRYKKFCKKLLANDIQPVVTLYHYTEPIWFYELGGFEKKENICHFENFCKTVFKKLYKQVYLWVTFNAPEGVAVQGWLKGMKPPAKKDIDLMANVLHNLLEAHVQVYQTLKALPEGKNSKIGIIKNILQLDAWNTYNPLDLIACYFGTDIIDSSIYKFFTSGAFTIKSQDLKNLAFLNFNKTPVNSFIKNGNPCLDFVGLNYYGHNYVNNLKAIREPNSQIEIPTANSKYTIYAEGLYRALKELSVNLAKPLNIPIYITENGIATHNDEHRELHNKRYLFTLALAIQEGIDVRGYIHWSLMDNYEWGSFDTAYGIYGVDFKTQERSKEPRSGAKYLINVIKKSQE